MQRKILWLLLGTLLLTASLGSSVAYAQESENYNVMLNTWAGGNYGGTTLTSTSYKLILSSGGAIQVSSTSGGYELCSGFVCQADKGFFDLHLPALTKSAE